MNSELEKFFKKDEDAFYEINGDKKLRGVRRYYNDTVRNDKADEQAKLSPVSFSEVFSYVNDFLELIRADNGHKEKIIRCDCIALDNIQQVILDNGIIAINLSWKDCEYDKRSKKYMFWDAKYDTISEKFNLNNPYDIVWLKFTNKGHLGVVAKSFDINFKDELSSGLLVKQVDEQWDKSFVFIFPLTPDILENRTSGDLEIAIGNYLILKGVPIIDYYSHNN
ncbi:MAG: hypothetical protein CVV02_05675 [Firmicutes bacterium HGW-Firmicutes-7]|nr:MAG: hypothetical protein CVV02_05675 [Firmicutes bacterium HGW-Firmicutes-7]